MIVGVLVLALVAYKAFSHSNGRPVSSTQDPEVDFYYAVRDKVIDDESSSSMSIRCACDALDGEPYKLLVVGRA